MGNEELQNNQRREPVTELLAGLKRVEAPTNFDFGVRARIAAGKPVKVRGVRIPVLIGYAMPLVLLVFVGGYFGLRYFYSTKDANVPAVAVASTTAPQLPSPAEVATAPTPEQVASAKKTETVTAPDVLAVKKISNTKSEGPSGGSFDEGSSVPRKIYRNTQIPLKDVLSLIGAKGSFGENGWKVDAPTANSLAERSGVQAGDVIEAINDQAVTEKTSFKSRSGIKSVRVRRDGKSIDIALRN